MEKEKGVTLAVRGIFYVLFLGIVFWGVWGMHVLPSEKDSIKGTSSEFVSEWYQILGDGSREAIDIPGRCSVQKGETAVAETVIPQTVEDGKYLCFRSSQQDMRVYVDGELRYQYNTENSRIFGKMSASAYVFVEMYAKDAGKILRVETESVSNYSGIMNVIYYGDKFSIWENFSTQYGAGLVIALLMLAFAIICILFGMALKYLHDRSVVLEYLGWGILLVAIWVIAENRLRQLFFANISVMENVAFFAMMLLPLPFAIYINSIQKFRYSKCYSLVYTLVIMDFLVCTVLQMLNIKDFSETMIMMHVVMILCVLLIVVTILIDIKRKYIHSYRLVAFGIVGLVVTGIMEICNVYVNNGQVTGNGLCLGLIFLLATAVIKTGQDILGIERERQRAISDNETKESFFAKMSHEIRTPINTIIGMNEMIARESTDKAIEEYVTSAQEAGRTLLALVNDVLDFSTMESGNLNLTEHIYQLASLINEEVYMLQTYAAKKKLEVAVNVDKKLPSYLYGDEVRIKQIVGSIVSNAVKYTEKGCITLTIGSSSSDAGDFFLKIFVSDTGIGISEKNIEHIFDGISKSEDKNNIRIAGTGLDLHIIKRLLDEMQGEIKVRSICEKGSLFTVTIPQKVINATPIGAFTDNGIEESTTFAKYKPSFIAPEVKVLAVDDNEMSLAVIKGFLKQTQIQLDLALSGEECLNLCKEKRYHVILMEHLMSELDGIETLQLLRTQQDGCNEDTPVVVVTVNAVAGSRETYLAEGFAEYLPKPVVPDMLEKVLKQFIPEELMILEGTVEDEAIEKEEDNLSVTASSDEKDVQEENVQEENIPEEEIIMKELGLSYCGGDEEFYMEMLDTYHKQGKEYAQNLPEYYKEKNWKQYSITTHAMKSTSLSIGARKFSDMAKEHEMAGKSEDGVWIEENWDAFYEEFIKVLNKVEELLPEKTENEMESLEKELISQEDYGKECELLLDYLRNYEMNAALEQTEKLESLEIAEMDLLARNEQFEKIKTAIDDFDYGTAEELLEEWMKGV